MTRISVISAALVAIKVTSASARPNRNWLDGQVRINEQTGQPASGSLPADMVDLQKIVSGSMAPRRTN
jgi:hypothetical protein